MQRISDVEFKTIWRENCSTLKQKLTKNKARFDHIFSIHKEKITWVFCTLINSVIFSLLWRLTTNAVGVLRKEKERLRYYSRSLGIMNQKCREINSIWSSAPSGCLPAEWGSALLSQLTFSPSVCSFSCHAVTLHAVDARRKYISLIKPSILLSFISSFVTKQVKKIIIIKKMTPAN